MRSRDAERSGLALLQRADASGRAMDRRRLRLPEHGLKERAGRTHRGLTPGVVRQIACALGVGLEIVDLELPTA